MVAFRRFACRLCRPAKAIRESAAAWNGSMMDWSIPSSVVLGPGFATVPANGPEKLGQVKGAASLPGNFGGCSLAGFSGNLPIRAAAWVLTLQAAGLGREQSQSNGVGPYSADRQSRTDAISWRTRRRRSQPSRRNEPSFEADLASLMPMCSVVAALLEADCYGT